ncbi:helicase-related protein [uncultured Pedobacter sp.]|uniref:Eco57I restriction-modification methylase domain-containing protein n=1 Tax=uncultured Pedobacter sp. TaxID=246139 RepID=UPI002631C4F5|nr:helicase-related protein [uncultured Pedobacter sp.]
MAYNIAKKLRENIDAIRIAMSWVGQHELTPEQVDTLKKYSGFGGIKAILYPYGELEDWRREGASKQDLRLHGDIMKLHDLIRANTTDNDYKNIIASLRNSVLTAFYTPEIVPQQLYKVLKEQGIEPSRIYEPSAGAGIFISQAAEYFPHLSQVTAVEKDRLTGEILRAINSSLSVPTTTLVMGLEDVPGDGDGTYDLVVSNIPYGNFSVYDPTFNNKQLTGKIHNYFFAKGLEKLCDGGMMAYITTDAFLNSPSNQKAREYLFRSADFVALAAMPDQLMKGTGNTEAPNHLLIVQKNTAKEGMSGDEKLLCQTEFVEHGQSGYDKNSYLIQHPEVIIGDRVRVNANQYGQLHEAILLDRESTQLTEKLAMSLTAQLERNFKHDRYQRALGTAGIKESLPKLTYLPMPEAKAKAVEGQLGLFDMAPAEQITRASAYLSALDQTVVQAESASVVCTIRTADKPTHEIVVLLRARQVKTGRFLYKLYSNVAQIDHFSANWMDGRLLGHELAGLAKALQQYDHQFSYEGDQTMQMLFVFGQQAEAVSNLKHFYVEGTLIIHREKVGILSKVNREGDQATFEPLAQQSQFRFYQAYVEMRDHYMDYAKEQSLDDMAGPALRDRLEKGYDEFVKTFGQLNAPENRRRILEDRPHALLVLSSLERREDNRFVKADTLLGEVKHIRQRFVTDDPIKALAHSLNDLGKVDIDFISTVLELEPEEAIDRLGNHIYLEPSTDSWQTADAYLSGNVVEKLRAAEEAFAVQPDNQQYARSLKAIKEVQPEHISFDMLDFNLGERWIPLSYYERFASDLFDLEVSVDYFSSIDSFKVKGATNIKVSNEYAITPKQGNRMNGYTLMEHALENTTPFFSYEISIGEGKTKRIPDSEAIQLAHQKIDGIRQSFSAWLRELPDNEKQAIEKLYNDTFNCYVLREFDGSHLEFPGMDRKALGIVDLYSSQKNAAWRIIQNRGALIDHEVGLGKTLTMIVAAREMKRLGIISKPMILALKANVGQIAETYKKAYPGAKILYPDEKDFNPTNRLRLFHEIKNNNWDCIILTHEQFGRIPQSPEIQQEIFSNELANVERDLETVKELGGQVSRSMLKGLEIRKNNLNAKLQHLRTQMDEKKDRGIDFRALGVDHLFIDEAHKFKNLTFTTRHNRVAGLGNVEGSQKALNMLFAVRELQNRFNSDLCVTFLSGTPISNSLTEMYLLFKYLRPKEMERQRIENFDAWAAVFARKTTDFEFSVTNEIIAKERFRHFIKIPELALFYNEITDYKTAKHISLDKPELDEELVNIPPTPEQQAFIKNLMSFARTGNASLIGRTALSPQEDKGRMLIATNYAKKMAVDMRLIHSEHYGDHPANKINTCARKVSEIYRESEPQKGTQIIFCDIGTPKPHEFNVYDALKEKLVKDFNIPSEQITFIHDWTDRRKIELFKKMNSGEIRILLGSTDKAGTGTNVQRRVVAMHHLDIPWKPSELEQRNGRGARQGNVIAKGHYDNRVASYIYAVEQSLDNYKFNLLKNKQTFISQMKNCELNVRTIDEGAIDENGGMNFSEYIAILSGDTSLLEKSRLEKKIAVLEGLRVSHFREASRNQKQMELLKEACKSTAATLDSLNADSKVFQSKLEVDQDGAKINGLELNKVKSADPEIIGKQLIELYQSWQPRSAESNFERIGSLYGFGAFIQRHREAYEENGKVDYVYSNSFFVQREKNGIRYTYNSGNLNVDNPKVSAKHFLHALEKIGPMVKQYRQKLEQQEAEVPKLEELCKRPFGKEKELQQLRDELFSLERRIATKIQETQLNNGQHSHAAESSQTEILSGASVVPLREAEPKMDKVSQKMYAAMRKNTRIKFRRI